MNGRRLFASLLLGVAVGWGMWLAPLQWPRATLPAPKDATSALGLFFSPDTRHLITVHFHPYQGDPPGNLGSANLWNTASGARVAQLTDRERLINSVAYSPDGATIAGRQERGQILLWDRATGRLRDQIWNDALKDAHPNAHIVFNSEGRLLFQVGQNWTLMRYVDTSQVAFDFRSEVSKLSSGTINHQGFYLAAGNRQAVVVRLDTGERIARFTLSDGEMDVNGGLSPDGRSYAAIFWTNANRVVVWTSETGTTLPPIPWLINAWNVQNRLALANDAALLAVYTTYHPRKWILFGEESKEPRHRIHLIEPKMAQEVGRIEGGQRAVFAPDGQTLAVTLANGDVQLWDVPMRKPWEWIGLAAAGSVVLTYLLLTSWRKRRLRRQGTAA